MCYQNTFSHNDGSVILIGAKTTHTLYYFICTENIQFRNKQKYVSSIARVCLMRNEKLSEKQMENGCENFDRNIHFPLNLCRRTVSPRAH